MSALLLNVDYSPLRCVAHERAIELIWEEKAEIVEESGQFFHSQFLTIPVPSVLRLLKFAHVPYRKRLPVTRRNVLARDGGKCGYCLASASTIDHIRPRSKGGRHRWENVISACIPCNSEKDDRQLSVILGQPRRNTGGTWELKLKPFVPEGAIWTAIDSRRHDPVWEKYLPA